MYKAVLFDLDNTLLNYTSSELSSMKRTIFDHQILNEEQEGWEAFWEAYLTHNAKHWIEFVTNIGPHKSIEEVLISSFRDALNLNQALHEQLSATYWAYFCNSCHFEIGAEEVLHAIKTKYKLGIISNGIGSAQRKRLAAGNITHMFDSVLVSDEAGIRKPEKEIFERALNELGVSSEEVLFVGDSITDDYHGALNAGIDFCFYNRNLVEMNAEIKPKYVINELQELLQLI